MTSPPQDSWHVARGPWLWALLPALIALASRCTALSCGFAMDDGYNIVDNSEIRSFGAAWAAATHALAAQGSDSWTAGLNAAYWRPVAILSWAIDYALWGLSPVAFHATNLALHAVTATLLASMLRGLRLDPVAAALAASWWAAHTVHSETVTLVTYRTELIAGLCMVAAMQQAATRADNGRPWALALLFAVGLGAKESAASLPCLWVAVALTRRWQVITRGVEGATVSPWSSPLGSWGRRRANTIAAMALVAVIWAAIRLSLVHPTALPFFGAFAPWQVVLSSVAIVGKEASWLVLPWPLAPFWDLTMLRPVLSLAQPELWAGVAWLLLLALGLGAHRERPLLALAAAIWLAAKLPTSQLIPLPVGAAERFGYIASIGAALVLAWGLHRAMHPQVQPPMQSAAAERPSRRGWMSTAVALWIVALSIGSAVRALDFRDDDVLAAATVRDHPDGFNGWHLLGKRALARGDVAAAIEAFDRAATILPGFAPNERLREQAHQAAAGRPGGH